MFIGLILGIFLINITYYLRSFCNSLILLDYDYIQDVVMTEQLFITCH